ncbi:Non-repetitive/WGA-negative nucleoporin C-terminal-domain-containing protein [Syncephalis plumigaleata]|nr:Non-repetitive/WGA-negative nucleoporin C-terminal-domain-containing protein [Syncephalis plumigaleata]
MATSEPIEVAAKLLDSYLERDQKFPELADLVLGNAPRNLPLYQKNRFIALPDALFEQYDLLQCRNFTGVFPEIRCAWFTLDHRLFIWNYENGCVPKYIEHLLVVTTALEVFLLGISVGSNAAGGQNEVVFYVTKMSTPADNIIMTSVIGTDTGRIFTCGSDGHIYELCYGDDGWINRGFRKINLTLPLYTHFVPTFLPFFSTTRADPIEHVAVDNSRHLLYGLTQNSSIELFNLGSNGLEFHYISTCSDIPQVAASLCPSLAYDTRALQLVSIHPVTSSESSSIYLMGVVDFILPHNLVTIRLAWVPHPCRMYPMFYALFTFDSPGIPIQPVGVSANAVEFQLASLTVHTADCSSDVFLASHTASNEVDQLVCTALDVGAIAKNATINSSMRMSELHSVIPVDGKTSAIAEIRARDEKISEQFTNAATIHRATNAGVNLISKTRPIDQLRWLLNEFSPQSPETKQFVDMYGASEVCSMCLMLCCNTLSYDGNRKDVASQMASRMFFEVGGVPRFQETIIAGGDNSVGRALSSPTVIYSGKHDGIALTIIRLLRPIWHTKLISITHDVAIPEPVLLQIQQGLVYIRQFMVHNMHGIEKPHIALQGVTDITKLNAEHRALETERQSLLAMKQLLTQAIEAISFLQFLRHRKLPEKAAQLAESSKNELVELTFRSLLAGSNRLGLCQELILTIIDQSAGRSLESISEVLRERCPHFCSGDNLVLFQAQECLRQANIASTTSETERNLKEALRLYTTIPNVPSKSKIIKIANSFKDFGFYNGAIEFALACATPNPALSIEANKERRDDCYQVAIEALFAAQTRFGKDIEDFISLVLNRVLASKDQAFHFALYDWYMNQRYLDLFTRIDSAYMEAYLAQGDSLEKLDLLWQYYIRHNEFSKASRLQERLAMTTDYEITLDKRVEYLSRSIANGRSALDGRDREESERLRDIQEKLEVAQIQVYLVKQLIDIGQTKSAQELQGQLMDLNELFHRYARQFQLYECQLMIFTISGYSDAAAIKTTWRRLLQKITDEYSGQVNTHLLVTRRVGELAEKFLHHDFIFPLDTICDFLGQLAYTVRQQESGTSVLNYDMTPWMAESLMEAHIPPRLIFTALNQLVEDKVRETRETNTNTNNESIYIANPWNEPIRMRYLLSEICVLLELWLPLIISGHQSDFPAAWIDEMLNQYLLTVNTLQATQLTDTLKQLQRRIRTLF